MPALKVAVIGGGIGGVATALFLREAGIDVTVFEQARELREIGAGIQVSPNAVRLLERAGLGGELAAVSAVPDVIWQFHRWRTGDVVFEHVISETDRKKWGAPFFLMRRSALLNAMVHAVPPECFVLGSPCTAVANADGGGATVTIAGEDHPRRFDAVVAADGIRSRIRSELFAAPPPTFSGYIAFRAVAPIERTPLAGQPLTTGVWLGPDRHFVHYPIERGELINLVCAVPVEAWPYESGSADGTIGEFAAAFEGWHPSVDALIRSANETRRFGLFYGDPLDRWVDGSVALLGDSAHPMLSFFAQGSAQAIEDASVVAMCLSGRDVAGVPEGLRDYEAIRKPRADAVQQNANERRATYHYPDGPEQEERDRRLASSDPMAAHSWVYDYDVNVATRDYYTAAGRAS